MSAGVWIGVAGAGLGIGCAKALARWLGWRRRGDWRAISGWGALSEATRTSVVAVEDVYRAEGTLPRLRWWGHATVEVHWQQSRLLIDPIAAGRIAVARRWTPPPEALVRAHPDVICLSHAHMDHLNNATLERLEGCQLMLPAGSERFLSRKVRVRHEIHPLRLGEERACGRLSIRMVEARHGGWRYPWQRGLFACGYVIRGGSESLYVAGDTAHGPHFSCIGATLRPRVALVPIGAYAPRWFLKSRHLNPEEAVTAAVALGAEYVIPYHFGTYRLSTEPMQEPLVRFAQAAQRAELKWFLPADALP